MGLNEKMTALADEVRALSGTTTPKSIDTMTSDVNAANTEIAEQLDLISQIENALEGKASGGNGGEDVTDETDAYTTKIAELENVVSALEEELEGKASGGAGGVETCTVTILCDVGMSFIVYGANSTGAFTEAPTEVENQIIWSGSVIKNSIIVTLGMTGSPQISDNAEILMAGPYPILVYYITGDCDISWF